MFPRSKIVELEKKNEKNRRRYARLFRARAREKRARVCPTEKNEGKIDERIPPIRTFPLPAELRIFYSLFLRSSNDIFEVADGGIDISFFARYSFSRRHERSRLLNFASKYASVFNRIVE